MLNKKIIGFTFLMTLLCGLFDGDLEARRDGRGSRGLGIAAGILGGTAAVLDAATDPLYYDDYYYDPEYDDYYFYDGRRYYSDRPVNYEYRQERHRIDRPRN